MKGQNLLHYSVTYLHKSFQNILGDIILGFEKAVAKLTFE